MKNDEKTRAFQLRKHDLCKKISVFARSRREFVGTSSFRAWVLHGEVPTNSPRKLASIENLFHKSRFLNWKQEDLFFIVFYHRTLYDFIKRAFWWFSCFSQTDVYKSRSFLSHSLRKQTHRKLHRRCTSSKHRCGAMRVAVEPCTARALSSGCWSCHRETMSWISVASGHPAVCDLEG